MTISKWQFYTNSSQEMQRKLFFFYTFHKIVDCDTQEENCSKSPEVKIIQVRHPFERLLSTYRHVFKNGGWKSLDASYIKDPKIEQFFNRVFSKSWPDFVDEIIIQNQLDISEDNLRNINFPGNCRNLINFSFTVTSSGFNLAQI